jgi:nucleotide-binding universal stress UspA family protein
MKILIYLDGECYTYPPILMGKIIAQATNGSITVLVIQLKDGHVENCQAVVDQLNVDLNGYSPEIQIRQGIPSEIIREELENEEYQLVITDVDRIHRVRKSTEIDPTFIKHSAISLLITQNTKPKLDKILVCSACKEDDFSLINQAAGLAQNLKASVTLMHVFPGSVPSMYTGLEQIEETIEEILQTATPYAQYLRKSVEILQEAKLDSEVKIRRGIPIEEIVRETQMFNYDLVVIGSSEVNQGLKEMLMGNMTKKIIDRVELPVLIIGTRVLT